MNQTLIWRDLRQLTRHELPDAVRPWLLDRGSLTERLIEASNGHFRVQLLQQQWQLPTQDEARLLHLPPRQYALIREVLLLCHDEPWVYARSVLPYSSLQGSLQFLRKLRESALGALLFKDPHLQRSRFEICQLQLPHPAIPGNDTGMIYGRRSLFHLQKKPLSVAEIFLPACKLAQHHNNTRQLSLHGGITL